jgi:hypothetical protein
MVKAECVVTGVVREPQVKDANPKVEHIEEGLVLALEDVRCGDVAKFSLRGLLPCKKTD